MNAHASTQCSSVRVCSSVRAQRFTIRAVCRNARSSVRAHSVFGWEVSGRMRVRGSPCSREPTKH
eukprot:6285957-Lingulodinium_polyedra.AAC.1